MAPSRGLEDTDGIHKLREHLANMKKSLTASSSGDNNVSYHERDEQVTMRDGTLIAVRIHSPSQPASGGCPGLVIYHGGGFCLGGLDNEVALCRKWTALGGVAVNVDYRLAPENVFPTAVHDAYDALTWVCAFLDCNLTEAQKLILTDCTKRPRTGYRREERIHRRRYQCWGKSCSCDHSSLPG